MVGQRPLKPSILVRIQVRQPNIMDTSTSFSEWITPTSDWQEITNGVRFRTLKFAHFPAIERDGAEIEMQAGSSTPIQYNATENTVYTEVPVHSKLFLLHVDASGNLKIYKYNSTKTIKPHFFTTAPGEIMTWIASRDQDELGIAKIMEHEKPGWSDTDFDVIEPLANEHKGHSISEEFWGAYNQLQSGNENLDIPVIELT